MATDEQPQWYRVSVTYLSPSQKNKLKQNGWTEIPGHPESGLFKKGNGSGTASLSYDKAMSNTVATIPNVDELNVDELNKMFNGMSMGGRRKSRKSKSRKSKKARKGKSRKSKKSKSHKK